MGRGYRLSPISGSTTFQNLLDWGLPKDVIEKVIGEAIPDPAMTVRDFLPPRDWNSKLIKINSK